MKKITGISLLLAAFLFCLIGQGMAQNTPLIVTSPFSDSLWTVDTSNGFVVTQRRVLTYGTFTPTGVNGMAVNPTTGDIYCVVKESVNTGNRRLAILDPATGALTDIGGIGDRFAGITFKNDTLLYGVTGDGASTSETLFSINITNASANQLTSLGNGTDGEAICYNPNDGFIYHASGLGTVNVDQIFERINSTTLSVTNIPFSGYNLEEVNGLAYIGNGEFLVSNINAEWAILNTSGFADTSYTHAAPLPNNARGFGFPLRYVALDSASTAACVGTAVSMTATDNGATAYQWYQDGVLINGATSRTYSATANGNYNCMITVNGVADSSYVGATVAYQPGPTVTMGQDSALICPGGDVLLTGTGTGTNPQWYLNGAPIGGATGFNYTATTAGQYNLQLTDAASGCTDTSATGTVVDQFVALGMQIMPGGPVDLCNDGTIAMLSTTPGATSYQWYQDGVAIAGATTDMVSIGSGGSITVSAIFSGCPDSSIAPVVVNMVTPPTADFSANPDTVLVGDPVSFTDLSTNASAWDWDFGDSNSSTSQNPTNTYSMVGTYTVTLLAENPPCAADSISRVVVVEDTMASRPHFTSVVNAIEVYPNPSRNSVNLRLSLTAGEHVSIEMYNALGQRVRALYSKDLTPGTHQITWDGRDDAGNLTDAGVYIARLTVGDEVMPVRVVRLD